MSLLFVGEIILVVLKTISEDFHKKKLKKLYVTHNSIKLSNGKMREGETGERGRKGTKGER